MNIIELQKLSEARGDAVSAMVIQNFMENESFYGAMSFDNVPVGTFSKGWNEEKTLAGADTRSLNSDYTASETETEQRQEALKVYGGKVGVDYVARNQLGEASYMKAIESQIKAIRLKVMNDFFNGSSASDINAFDGLKTLLPTTTAGQIDRGYIVANGGGALSRKKLDELLGNVDTDSNTVIFADKMMPYLMNQYAESLVTFDKNDFGVAVPRYGDIPIVTIDKNNLATKILGFSESGSTSSLFVANLDIDKVTMLTGAGGMLSKATDSGSQDISQVDWLLSLAIKGKYNAGRLHGFTNTSMVA